MSGSLEQPRAVRDPITTGELTIIAAADTFCESVLSGAATLNPRTLARVFGQESAASLLELLDHYADRGRMDGTAGF